MKRTEALLIAPLLAFAPTQFSRAQVPTGEVMGDICTSEGAMLEDGESANGRSILTRLEETTAQFAAAQDDTTRDRLFQEFLVPALSCTASDVDAAQVTLSRRPLDPKHPVDVDRLQDTLTALRDVLVAQETEPMFEETIPPDFEEEVPALVPPPLFSHV